MCYEYILNEYNVLHHDFQNAHLECAFDGVFWGDYFTLVRETGRIYPVNLGERHGTNRSSFYVNWTLDSEKSLFNEQWAPNVENRVYTPVGDNGYSLKASGVYKGKPYELGYTAQYDGKSLEVETVGCRPDGTFYYDVIYYTKP